MLTDLPATVTSKQRVRDHDLVFQLYRMAERWVEMKESFQSPSADELREVLRAFSRENVLGRILKPKK